MALSGRFSQSTKEMIELCLKRWKLYDESHLITGKITTKSVIMNDRIHAKNLMSNYSTGMGSGIGFTPHKPSSHYRLEEAIKEARILGSDTVELTLEQASNLLRLIEDTSHFSSDRPVENAVTKVVEEIVAKHKPIPEWVKLQNKERKQHERE